MDLNTQAQQREAVVQGRSLSPYRLRYTDHNETFILIFFVCFAFFKILSVNSGALCG
ncbi:MAG: hypothetical protein LBJ00_13110 [Planctomycetaceae bacterium]|nr:hypothetical protein [Planctomycetaceae bacterium]